MSPDDIIMVIGAVISILATVIGGLWVAAKALVEWAKDDARSEWIRDQAEQTVRAKNEQIAALEQRITQLQSENDRLRSELWDRREQPE